MATEMAEKDTTAYPWHLERRYFSWAIVLVFVILSATAYLLCDRHHAINTEQILNKDRSTASLLSLVLDERLNKLVSVMESFTKQPLLLKAVRERSAEKATEHLAGLARSNAGIDSQIITDPSGTLWAAYPARPEVMGKNFAFRDWYKEVSKEWKPIISDLFLRIVREKDHAIPISVPIIEETGEVIGILTNTQRTVEFASLFRQVPLDPGQSVTVTDRKGQVLYDSRQDVGKEIQLYPFHSGMKQALAGKNRTFPVDDPDSGGRERYVSFSPAAGSGFTLFVERDRRSILLSESTYYIQVTVIALLLFLAVVLLLAYSRKRLTAQRILEQLQAEKELQNSEACFRELFDNMSSGVAVYRAVDDGEDFILLDLNEAGQKMTQLYTDFAGRRVCDLFPGVKPLGLFRVFQDVWKTGETAHYPSSQYQDGRLTFWVENHVFKLPSGEVVALFDDVTDRKRVDTEILKLNAELEQRVLDRTARLEATNRELEAFSYSVSHDLRGPLRSIDGFSLALLEEYEEKLDDTGKSYLERVRRATQLMGRLIDDLLKLSRVARSEVHLDPIDLSGMVREMAGTRQKGNTGQAVEVAVQQGITVRGDPHLIRIAMENLVDNAFKFTGKTAHPRIAFGASAGEGETVCYIRDNGAGFDMAYVDKLFGAFQRLHTKEEFAGTGIGLATVRRIINRHGGRVWAEGEIDKGATFSFTLPGT